MIEDILDKLKLTFLGFEFSDNKRKEDFKTVYPKQCELYNLNKWNDYETMNPELFSAMYQFWVQKL